MPDELRGGGLKGLLDRHELAWEAGVTLDPSFDVYSEDVLSSPHYVYGGEV